MKKSLVYTKTGDKGTTLKAVSSADRGMDFILLSTK